MKLIFINPNILGYIEFSSWSKAFVTFVIGIVAHKNTFFSVKMKFMRMTKFQVRKNNTSKHP